MTFQIYTSVYLMRPDNAPDHQRCSSTCIKLGIFQNVIGEVMTSNSDQYELLLNAAQHPVPSVTS